MPIIVEASSLSDTGRVRTENEDYCGYLKGAFGCLMVLCDGMGGYYGGSIASRLAAEIIFDHFACLSEEYDEMAELRASLFAAHKAIREKSESSAELSCMGTTAAVLLIRGEKAFTAHIGDSRIYLARRASLRRLTKDHSLVQHLLDTGMISREEVKHHPHKNIITRALGADEPFVPEINDAGKILNCDRFLLCSDGLTNHIEDEEILDVLVNNSAEEACGVLVDLANNAGGKDNITVMVACISK